MLTANLLPASEKKVVYYEELRLIIRFFALLIAAVFLLGSLLFLPFFLSLSFERRELERSLRLEEGASQNLKVKETKAKISALQDFMASLDAFLSVPPRASSLVEDLLRDAGTEIVIQGMGISQKGGVVISGVAQNRKAMLNFEKKLRDSGRLQELTAPIPVKEANINFTMQGKLKPLYGL